jgi:hypothetical protein
MLPPNYKQVNGDLLSLEVLNNVNYIAHQCNCVSTNSAGFYKSLVMKFPSVDVYRNRSSMTTMQEIYTKPGTITILQLPNTQCSVIHMFSQFYPGTNKEFQISKFTDDRATRQRWFGECLQQIADSVSIGKISIAFPYKIGCGLAGGNWKTYEDALINFAAMNNNIDVYVINNNV